MSAPLARKFSLRGASTVGAAVLAGCLLSGSPPVRAAPATGDLRVAVTDEGGRPVAGASIEAESRGGNAERAMTDAGGVGRLAGLEAGLYRVSASREGHVRVVEPSVLAVRGKTVPVEMVLRRRGEGPLEEIVVVADAVRRDAFGAVSSSYLDREHLRTATGSGADVLRALDGLPGLFSTGEFASFTVRGRGPRDNLILVDGFPYDKVAHFDQSLGEQEDIEGGGRFSIFPPNLIDGAEFSPGGWSAAHGGRNGSLLKLNVARGNPSASASLRLDIAGAELVYDGPSGIRQDTSLIMTARRFDFGRLFDAIGEKDIGEPVMTDVVVKTHTRLDARNRIELLALRTPETARRGVEHVLASEGLEDRTLLDAEQDSTLLGMTWTRLFGESGRWENRVYRRDTDKTGWEGEAFADSTPTALPADQAPARERIFTLRERETETGWRSDVSARNGWGLFGAGLRVVAVDLDFGATLDGDWIRYAFDGRRDFRPDPAQRFIVLTPEHTDAAFSRSEPQYAAYAEQTFQRGDWDVRVGLRYERDGFSDEGHISPRLAVNHRLSAQVRLSATAGTFHQSPRFLDRAADPANFGLRSERVDHMSLGVERQFGENWNVLVEAYRQRLDDLVTEGDAVTGMAGNGGRGTSFGVDVVVNRLFADGWSANAVYSFNDATLDDGDGEYPADHNHEHLFSVGARWELSERWQVGFRWKYATGRPRDEFVVHENVLAGLGGPLRFSREHVTNNTARWDDFHALNARVDYRRPVGPADLVAFLDVLNVYGAPATDELEFNPATGSSVVEDGETVPLIGIRFERSW